MQSEDLGAKAIVFSQFVNMLDLISYRLQRGGLQCVKLSGSMSLEQRDKCITAFKADPDVKVSRKKVFICCFCEDATL